MKVPENLKYTTEHEWIRVQGNTAWVGITDFAQHELGEIVFVEVETLGENIHAGEVFGTVEAVKTVSELFLPISGEILEFNKELENKPELLNDDPYGEGWIVKIRVTDPSELEKLLSAEQYAKLIA
ncbi:MAG TPA: glycine cleavage system protein GcvH [Paludibacteraceae bacterium]|nr:glycine cleavage system protein GcvH [Paludibacteraceae bacterium]OPZ03131.1 MAG: Glycine cleavage system H protein [Bacteroidetes bacterium ADurb.BinA395]HOJ65638.1 glycine cleavage system protein GcvH [Paludibacteraceae bacterium]HOL29467.1 glycine cleavage system protein GcvH [Paludibacteraceae bacterium]HON02183.1 glycine cleavage system protein GcvH [Paludibacteraceae bacterium]